MVIVPDRLTFLWIDGNACWMGDVKGRFSLCTWIEGHGSVIVGEQLEKETGNRSKGGGGAGGANSWWPPLVLPAVARDRNVIPYFFGGVDTVAADAAAVSGYWSINCERRSSLKSNEDDDGAGDDDVDDDETPLAGAQEAWRHRQTPLPHKRRVWGSVDEGTLLFGTTAVVELDVDEQESVDFFVKRRRASSPSVTDDSWNWPAFWNARIVTLTARTWEKDIRKHVLPCATRSLHRPIWNTHNERTRCLTKNTGSHEQLLMIRCGRWHDRTAKPSISR